MPSDRLTAISSTLTFFAMRKTLIWPCGPGHSATIVPLRMMRFYFTLAVLPRAVPQIPLLLIMVCEIHYLR